MKRGNPDNLIPNTDLTPEELRKRNSKAGKASVKAKRIKKLMSEIYAEFLTEEHNIEGIKDKLSGNALVSHVMGKVLTRGDSASVSLMKEVREATEGSKLLIDPIKIRVVFGNDDNDPADIPADDIPADKV